ncbi:hypothetical protein [Botrimarina mediterranea]|uniref:Uncharacterized protein n=1 Tax=Botrimarina mediterranea TaxID=2528022 RepID=A0A518K9T6_9BACT|nr:hypothetical protein [Botrimarina mediterranea]QDV74554.1 hypothetical protein Spa11_27580 [Botrimarina mediterranea]QDV79194.1 hypothetical protein K2D_28050 [Planctomycetes bacterium K2D]
MSTNQGKKRTPHPRVRLLLMAFGVGDVLIGLARLPDELMREAVLGVGRLLAQCLPW